MPSDFEVLLPSPPKPAVPIAAIDSLLSRYGLVRQGEPMAVDESIVNENFRVETSGGPRFARIHKASRTLERLHLEHAVIDWTGRHGIPVNAPETDSAGRALHTIGERNLSLYRWLNARHLQRGEIDAGGAATLGAMQGRIHRVFSEYDGPSLPRGGSGTTWDTEASIQVLSRVDDLIRYYPAHSEWTLEVQSGLRDQLELLESNEARPCSDFAGLYTQPVHGDYHPRNVMLDTSGAVAAVVDWEMATVIPPVFEVVRCLTFGDLLDPTLLEAYLRAYRCEFALRPEDCAPGVEMWWQDCIHNTWAFRTRYIEGDRRVDRFFAEGRATIAAFRDPAFRTRLAERLRHFAS